MPETILRDYLSLRIGAGEFLKQILSNDELLSVIQSKLPDSKCAFDEVWENYPISAEAFEYSDFDLRRLLSRGYYSVASVSTCDHAYDLIYDLFHDDFPDIPRAKYYYEITMFAIDTVPEVVDSPEAGALLMKIIESAWKLEKGRKTAVRTAIRSAFHLDETKKRPRWAQSSLWPIGKGEIPMRFLSQKTDGDKVTYHFEDATTLEKRDIVDYY